MQLHLTQIIRIGPGETAQLIHRDRWAWGKHLAHVTPQFNTVWVITDFSSENGATQVVPGSTQWPDDAQISPGQITQAEMKVGSVLVYSGSDFHGGGDNRSTHDRIGINIAYTLGWLRQEENQYLTCPPGIAKDLDRPLQELIGYSMGQYALGYFTPRVNRVNTLKSCLRNMRWAIKLRAACWAPRLNWMRYKRKLASSQGECRRLPLIG